MIGDNNNNNIPIVTVTVTDDGDANNNNNIQQSISLENENNNSISNSIVTSNSTVAIDNNNVMCLSNGAINLNEIPVSVMSLNCRRLLSKLLNSIKVILSEDGVPRDWRGVLHWLCLDSISVGCLQSKGDPMGELLVLWSKERKDCATLGQLQKILGSIDRWDVVDDSSDYFGKYRFYFPLFPSHSIFSHVSLFSFRIQTLLNKIARLHRFEFYR